MSRSLGNITAGQVLTFLFPTDNGRGVPVAPLTAGSVYVYKDDGLETTGGITYTPSYNDLAGVNQVIIDTTGDFYESGHRYSVVLIGAVLPGTLGYGPATINTVLAEFAVSSGTTDASSFTGAFPAAALANAPRTGMVLSASSLARGPEASVADEDICTTAFKGDTARLTARVYLNGALITRTDVSTITYTIYERGSRLDERTPITGHTNVLLSAADVIYDNLQTDAQASRYNFAHQIPVSVYPAFTVAGRTYLAEYVITPIEGEVVIVRFQVICI